MGANISLKNAQIMGVRIRELREKSGLSQEKAAKIIGISTNHYAGIERGEENPSIGIIEQICILFKVKSTQIIPF